MKKYVLRVRLERLLAWVVTLFVYEMHNENKGRGEGVDVARMRINKHAFKKTRKHKNKRHAA